MLPDDDDDDDEEDTDDDEELEDDDAAAITADNEDDDSFRLAADCLESLVRVLLMVIFVPSECFTIYSDAGFFVSTDEFLAMHEDFPPSATVLFPLDDDDDDDELPMFFSFCPPLPPLIPEELLLFAPLLPLPQPSGSVQC